MHGAPYVERAPTCARVGRLGRSHGCPALRPAIARTVIDTIKQGSLVFAYYPDQAVAAGIPLPQRLLLILLPWDSTR